MCWIFYQGKIKCKCNPEEGCLGWANYGSDGEVNTQLNIYIEKVLVPPGTTPYDDIDGAKDSHDFALAVLEKNFDEVPGWGQGKKSQKSTRSKI